MTFPREKIGKQGRWPQALALFFIPISFIFCLRWLCYEPFVIPSESMVPNLFIHDHVLVQKYVYGIKPLFGDGWLIKWNEPRRGDVVVFRFPQNRDIFFIKRLIGLPGDKIRTQGISLTVNGQLYKLESAEASTEASKIYIEDNFQKKYKVQFESSLISSKWKGQWEPSLTESEEKEFIVPEKSYFVMGDNRFNSQDSRFWGMVPEKLLVGKARFIWLSCEETLISMPYVCDPLKLRFERLFLEI